MKLEDLTEEQCEAVLQKADPAATYRRHYMEEGMLIISTGDKGAERYRELCLHPTGAAEYWNVRPKRWNAACPIALSVVDLLREYGVDGF